MADDGTVAVTVPDLGEAEGVEVVEILVSVGQSVIKDEPLLLLESDKASMEVPAPLAGTVCEIYATVGLEVTEGSLLLDLQGIISPSESKALASEPLSSLAAGETFADAGRQPPAELLVAVPDAGEVENIELVELLVAVGARVKKDDPLLVLESDKASMEVPAPVAGEVLEIIAAVGTFVYSGDPLLRLRLAPGSVVQAASSGPAAADQPSPPQLTATDMQRKGVAGPTPAKPARPGPRSGTKAAAVQRVYAGPAVRRQARLYGVDLGKVRGSGRNNRIQIEDVRAYVRQQLSGPPPGSGYSGLPVVPLPDFARFGQVEYREMPKIRRASARNLHRSWLNTPQVTHFSQADISGLEVYRKSENARLQGSGVKLTALAFLIKAAVGALQAFPTFNSSLNTDADTWIVKKYYNIGIAVDTPDGLLVPVVRDADQKSLVELAQECADLAGKARSGKLPMGVLQGATFSISSLGGIGGNWFTPIVNAPEVAILGAARSEVRLVWDGYDFRRRTLLPLCLTYDHRAIDGAEAARFVEQLSSLLGDLQSLLS